ncbi:MAG TPA: hypothetical protein VN894_05125, partial [Polyangiaceae bacterium]|nr:hypothetical protein [Polyangiaceae bacterium]
GGLALWLRVPGLSATAVAGEALRRGVLVFPEGALRVMPGADDHFRIGFAALSAEEAAGGLDVVRHAMDRLRRRAAHHAKPDR